MAAEAPTYTLGNVLVGVAALYTAPAATAMPLDSVAQNAITTPWVPVGATEEGVSVQYQRDTTDIRIEEQSTPASVQVNATNFHVNTALSEDTVTSMKLAALFEGLNPQGFWRRVYVPNVLSVAEVTTAYRRAANNRSYAVSLRAICALSSIQIHEMTGPHT